MIRYGDLSGRTRRMVERMAEVAEVLPAEKVRTEQGADPLGFGLRYPVMFLAYDVNTGVEIPLSGLIHEDDPNLVVVSLVAEAIAQEDVDRLEADRLQLAEDLSILDGSGTAAQWADALAASYPAEIVTVMEVWS